MLDLIIVYNKSIKELSNAFLLYRKLQDFMFEHFCKKHLVSLNCKYLYQTYIGAIKCYNIVVYISIKVFIRTEIPRYIHVDIRILCKAATGHFTWLYCIICKKSTLSTKISTAIKPCVINFVCHLYYH